MGGLHWQIGVVQSQAADGGGGVGGGGSTPVTLPFAYFSDSSTSGAGAGVNAYIFRNIFFVNTGSGSQPYPTQSMTGTYLTGLSTATVTLVPAASSLSGDDETQSAYTLSTSTLLAFLNSASTPVTDPFTGKSASQQIHFNIGAFLQTPNGISTDVQYSILSAATNWTGIFTTFLNSAVRGGTTNSSVNSLAISNVAPFSGNSFAQATTGDWGISGTGTLSSNSNLDALGHIELRDFRAKVGGSPQGGETLTIRYLAAIQNAASSPATERTIHTVIITLT